MKKVFIAFIAMLSLVLMPMGVDAASYKDYFTIDSYFLDNKLGRGIVITLNTDNVTYNKEGIINELKGTYSMENMKGGFDPYHTENFSFYTYFPSDGESLKGVTLWVRDDGSKNTIAEARFQLVIDVNLKDYKSKLTIDLEKMQLDAEGKITNIDEIVTETLSEKEETKVEDKTVAISEETKSVSKDVIAEIKANKNKVTYENKKDDKVVYAWTFDGAKITDSDLAVDLELSVGSSDNEKDIKAVIPKGKENPLVLHFNHHGALPAGTSVKVNVSETYKNNEKLTLYYYNETTKKLEEAVTNITVKDGFAEFPLEHCSDYVLVKDNKSPNNSQTSSMDIVLYSIIAAGSLAGIVYFVVKSKKKIA